ELVFFFSSRRRHTRSKRDWSSDVCSSDLYDPLINFAGAGATVPITSFGNSLVQGALKEADHHGLIGVMTGIFEVTSAGISAAIIFGVIAAILFKAKGKH